MIVSRIKQIVEEDVKRESVFEKFMESFEEEGKLREIYDSLYDDVATTGPT